MSKVFEMLSRNLLVVVLLVLLCVEAASLFVVGPVTTWLYDEVAVMGEGIPAPLLKISEIDGPRIDDVAASVVASQTQALPGELWVFLLLAYMALLVFNFSYTFERVSEPQWGWEAFYTLIALWGWSVLDTERMYLWFPLMILKSGLILFALYVSLLERRLQGEQGEKEKQEKEQQPLPL